MTSFARIAEEVIDDALRNEPATRHARYEDYIHLVVSGCRQRDLHFDLERVDIIVAERFLVTVHRAPVAFLSSVRRDYHADFMRFAKSPSFLMYELWDHLLENYLMVQKLMEERVEQAFDGSRMVFYFTAEGRVDFRELVRELAAEFRTRIEMRQMGVRDEAKAIGGYGTCGRPLCCTTFLTSFEPVSIKMAKQQDLSLNPSKLSGLCGRLKCCLRYELPNAAGKVHGGCGSEGGCDNPGGCGAGGCGSGSCSCRA